MHVVVYIIIATSCNRTNWLLNRSLVSVYKQERVNGTCIRVLVIDDNEDDNEYLKIREGVSILRQELEIPATEFTTRVIKNARTRFMSGTGAWNTGIYLAYHENPDCYISILDDDDEYLNHHLANCIQEVSLKTAAVFQSLKWVNNNGGIWEFPLVINDLTPENFFIGNPGVQGSNMFFNAELLVAINGFDENLPNTTDRDLMIRFLWHLQKLGKQASKEIKVIDQVGVIHHNHTDIKVNNRFDKKQVGLDMFYRKYRSCFSEEAYRKSLNRAKLFFQYSAEEL